MKCSNVKYIYCMYMYEKRINQLQDKWHMMNSFRSGDFIIAYIEILIYYYYWKLHISCEFPYGYRALNLKCAYVWLLLLKEEKNEIGYKNSNGFVRLCQDVPIDSLFLLEIFMIRLLASLSACTLPFSRQSCSNF